MALEKETILRVASQICPTLTTYEFRDQLTLILPADALLKVGGELKSNPETSFDMLIDITAIDRLTPKDRFEVVYFLFSNKYKSRVRLKIIVQENPAEAPSAVEVWQSANWYERETFDMYGIKFSGHPNLRRFYMPEDYNDPETGEPIYPLRKDFPLMGIPGSLPLPPYPEKYGELN